MTALVGEVSLILAFGAAIFSALALARGAAGRSERLVRIGLRGVYGLTGLVTLAALSLWVALLTNDFTLTYVDATSRINQPLLYKIGAFWSSQEGSLLLWLWLLTLYMASSAFYLRRQAPDLLPYALAVQSVLAVFFAFMTAFVASPFETYPPGAAPPDGGGMSPLLRDPGMLAHPVFLFLGYVGLSVPYSFALATLLTRKRGSDWLRLTRPWTLLAWLFLTIGIVVGGWWAYHVLGWGGYWAWDPVENASFMPWLVATAFFHSAMVEERRGLLRNWNVLLIVFAFLLTIFGTFLVRSGILQSVHAFAQSDIGPWFMVFLGLLLAGSLYLVVDRYEVLVDRGTMESAVSKEGSFLLNNLILVAITLTVFIGVVYPLVMRQFGVEVTIGAPYYNDATGPLFAVLLLLMAVCPLIAWRRASLDRLPRLFAWPAGAAAALAVALFLAGVRKPGALFGYAVGFFVIFTVAREYIYAARARARITGEGAVGGLVKLMNRNPRRYGGYLVHLGIAMMGVAIVAMLSFQQVTEKGAVPVGGSFSFAGYNLKYTGIYERTIETEVLEVFAEVRVSRGGRTLGVVRPAQRLYPGWEQKMGWKTEAGILSLPAGDVNIVLGGWDDRERATFKIWWNPLAPWLWFGAWLLVLGTVFAVWPRPHAASLPQARDRAGRALRELGELEYDFRLGKVTAEDYAALQAELTREAAEALADEEPPRPGRG